MKLILTPHYEKQPVTKMEHNLHFANSQEYGTLEIDDALYESIIDARASSRETVEAILIIDGKETTETVNISQLHFIH